MALTQLPDKNHSVTNSDGVYHLRLDAFYGTTQSTSFQNAQNKLIVITNNNPDGILGTGAELIGKTIAFVTVSQGDLDTLGPERVRIEIFIDEPGKSTKIHEYDKPESEDATPMLMFNINFQST